MQCGDINSCFTESMVNMFQKTLKDMERLEVLEIFEARCRAIRDQTQDMGWGFGDDTDCLYEEYFCRVFHELYDF